MADKLKDSILKMAAELKQEVILARRHLHMNPELSFRETETASYICNYLKNNDIPFRNNIAGNGIIGEITGAVRGDRIIALRAEMDALPVNEKNEVSYASKTPGIMHACGHDAHMAMLLGSARILSNLRDHLKGKILLIFQPGEELVPGGAKLMIESGALDNPRPDIVIAQHGLPELESGKVGYKAGRYMASSDEIYITISGKGGHAALPGASTDQIYIASKLITRLKETIISLKEEKEVPTVLGIGRIIGDGATNVIPEKVEIAGTFRTFNEEWRDEAKKLISTIASDTARQYGVRIDVKIGHGYPVLVNDESLTARAIRFSEELLGKDKVEMFDIRMSSEDFAFFTEAFPSLYYRTGIRKKGGPVRNLHTADFDLDEEGLETGVANLTWLAVNFLKET